MSALLNEAESLRTELSELRTELESLPAKLEEAERKILKAPGNEVQAAMKEKAAIAERREILEIGIFKAEEALILNQTRQLEADLRPMAELEGRAEEAATAAAEALQVAQRNHEAAVAEHARLAHNRTNLQRQIESCGHAVANLRNAFKQSRRAANV